MLFTAVHICIERECRATLDFCLEWVRDDDVLISIDQSDETILHAGRAMEVLILHSSSLPAARASSSAQFHRTIRRILLHLSRLLDHERYLAFILKKNIYGRTAIHEAARFGHLSFLQLAFQSSIDAVHQRLCEETDQDFQTSLHLAAAAGKPTLSLNSSARAILLVQVMKRSFDFFFVKERMSVRVI